MEGSPVSRLAGYFRRRARALAFAEWLVREGQYQKADALTLDALFATSCSADTP